MGGKHSREDEVDPKDFEEAHSQQAHEGSDEEFVVVRNRVTHILYDRYRLHFSTEAQYQDYLMSINYRKNEKNIVRAFYIAPQHRKEFCSTNYIADIYLEHCRARLSEYKDIPYPDNLYCMMAMLNGYEKLSNNVGAIKITERQVLIDENGEVRVWINSDFSKNTCEEESFSNERPHRNSNAHRNWNEEKTEMVDRIMRIVIDSTDENDGPQLKFCDFYERQKTNLDGRIDFEDARSIILDYSRYVDLRIPDVFESVLEIYREEEELSDNNILPGGIVHQENQALYSNEYENNQKIEKVDEYSIPRHSSNQDLQYPQNDHFPPNMQNLPPANAMRMPSYLNHPPSTHQVPLLTQPIALAPQPMYHPPGNIVIRVPPPMRGNFAPSQIRTLPQPFLQVPLRGVEKRGVMGPEPHQVYQENEELESQNSDRNELDIENNLILKSSDNINGVDEEHIMSDLNEYHKQEEYREGHWEGHQEGHWQGYQEGYQEGHKEDDNSKININGFHDSVEKENQNEGDYRRSRDANSYNGNILGQEEKRTWSREQGVLGARTLNYSLYSGEPEGLRDSVPLRKEYYYTLNNEVELDPEIATDLYLFASSSLG